MLFSDNMFECAGTYPALFGIRPYLDMKIMLDMSILEFETGQRKWIMQPELSTAQRMRRP